MKSGRDIYLQFFRYYHTLKVMKFSQIVNFILFHHRRKHLTIIDAKRISLIAEGLKQNFKLEDNQKNIEFIFFNQLVPLTLDEMKWEQKDFTSEVRENWIKQLNSFDFIKDYKDNHINEKQINFLIIDWIAKNKNEHSESWEPYTLSKRLTSWVKWLNTNQVTPEIASIMKLSISLQLKRLFVDLEYHKPAYHLLENIRGFLFGCSSIINSSQYFNNEMEYQLEEIITEALKQINVQILSDGGHFERSPMYHSFALEIVKDIKELARKISKQGFLLPEVLNKSIELVNLCEEKIKLMNEWLEYLTMSDGFIAQFNDSSRIMGHSHSFENNTELLEPSGYFVKHEKDYSFILSCGSPSPSFLPEHSHCDMLSYELTINENRAIIDSGCSGYDNEVLRLMSRETESHNLPMIQHQEQSDIWGIYYFGKRARIIERTYIPEKAELKVTIEDQFKQIIERKIVFSNNKIEILDSLKKRRMQGCFVSLLHLDPKLELEEVKEETSNMIICKMTDKKKFSIITESNIRINDYISFPDFGKSIGAKMLILSNKEAEELSYVIKW